MSDKYTRSRADEIVARGEALRDLYRAKSLTRRVFAAGIERIIQEENLPKGRSTSEIALDQMDLSEYGKADPVKEAALQAEFEAAAWATGVRFRLSLLLNPPIPGSGVR